MAKELLHWLEIARDHWPLSTGEDLLRRKLKLDRLWNARWLECSQVLYLREGGANTSFFHQQSRYCKRKKNLYSQVSTFKWLIISQEEKLKAAFEFNDELLGTATDRDFNLPLIFH